MAETRLTLTLVAYTIEADVRPSNRPLIGGRSVGPCSLLCLRPEVAFSFGKEALARRSRRS